MRYLIISACFIAMNLTAITAIEAGNGGRPRLFRRWHMTRPVSPAYRHVSPYGSTYPIAEERYPKYIGSFHYRHLDNIGIPTGDIGIRGNSLYMSPW